MSTGLGILQQLYLLSRHEVPSPGPHSTTIYGTACPSHSLPYQLGSIHFLEDTYFVGGLTSSQEAAVPTGGLGVSPVLPSTAEE